MKQVATNQNQQEYLRILGKGMVTIPKEWRVELGLEEGDVVKAKKEGNKVVIETAKSQNAPYRVFSDEEINEFLKEDKLPKSLSQRVEKDLARLTSG